MKASIRQDKIIRLLKQNQSPLSGSYLSETLGVSRQIIVSDMNRLKEEGHLIISTPKGYMLDPDWVVQRTFKVCHSVEETKKELYLIVDLGAEVKDVFIYHRVYGELHAPLNISSRREADEFCNDIESGNSSPLSTVTNGYHYHTVTAKDVKTLDLVEQALKANNLYAKLTDFEPAILFERYE